MTQSTEALWTNGKNEIMDRNIAIRAQVYTHFDSFSSAVYRQNFEHMIMYNDVHSVCEVLNLSCTNLLQNLCKAFLYSTS